MNILAEGCLQFLHLCLNDMFCDANIAYICKKSMFQVNFYYKRVEFILAVNFLDSNNCESDWIRNGTSCYLPMQNQSSFKVAQADCLKKNATLATMHSQQEFETLKYIKISYLPSSFYAWVYLLGIYFV